MRYFGHLMRAPNSRVVHRFLRVRMADHAARMADPRHSGTDWLSSTCRAAASSWCHRVYAQLAQHNLAAEWDAPSCLPESVRRQAFAKESWDCTVKVAVADVEHARWRASVVADGALSPVYGAIRTTASGRQLPPYLRAPHQCVRVIAKLRSGACLEVQQGRFMVGVARADRLCVLCHADSAVAANPPFCTPAAAAPRTVSFAQQRPSSTAGGVGATRPPRPRVGAHAPVGVGSETTLPFSPGSRRR